MKTILKIFKNDLIGIKKSILTIVLAVGLCILPALYAWFNIFANWDPYANTGNINIAVVNLDKGYTDADGNEMNMGQSVADKLKSQTSIGWVFPDSEKSAIDGVKSGTYYAAVVIDEDAYRFATVGGFGGFLCQQEVEEFQFKAVGIIHVLQVLFIVLLRTVNRDFHKTFLQ